MSPLIRLYQNFTILLTFHYVAYDLGQFSNGIGQSVNQFLLCCFGFCCFALCDLVSRPAVINLHFLVIIIIKCELGYIVNCCVCFGTCPDCITKFT